MSILIPVAIAVVVIYLIAYAKSIKKTIRIRSLGQKLPGPTPHPVFGHIHVLATSGTENLASVFKSWARHQREKGDSIMKFFIMGKLYIWPLDGKATASIIDSTTELQKGDDYRYFDPWLGGGLLLEDGGQRWKSHRKMLTPAFHFAKLDGYFEIFNMESKTLIELLDVFAESGETVDIFPFVKRCALDIICGTAMGTKIDAQYNHSHTYVQAVEEINKLGVMYSFNPLLKVPIVFKLLGYKDQYESYLVTLKGFTEKVIKERRDAYKNGEVEKETSKRKMNFLDLLLNVEESNELSEEDIRQEVDTFMFAGHDTTTSSTSWACWNLAHNPEIQEKVYEELVSVFGDDPNTDILVENLNKLDYLERVLKESKRKVPPVPAIQRKLKNDIVMDGYTIPSGANITISPLALHDNEKVFKNPEIFDPDRFLPAQTANYHPYDYIPFSAGLRNCIGQKFARLNEKVMICHILRNFKLEPKLKFDETLPCIEVVTKPSNGIPLKLIRRSRV